MTLPTRLILLVILGIAIAVIGGYLSDLFTAIWLLMFLHGVPLLIITVLLIAALWLVVGMFK